MRTRTTIALLCLTVFTLAGLELVFSSLLFRNHIRDLAEVVRTYATFGSLNLELYTYPPDNIEDQVAAQSPQLAPKILHQIILREGRNSSFEKYRPARDSCVDLHPDWEHKLWTDDNATSFVNTYYPDILPHYEHYAQTIQRTNILRYLLLHHYGGVYLDVDITCRVSLDSLRHIPFVTPGAHPAGINNAFILAKPQHPFLSQAIARIPSRNLPWLLPYVENMLTTGCMFISNAWMEYMRHDDEIEWEDKVFVLADERGELEGHMLRGEITTPLFKHGGASSWHSWDARVIVLLGKYGKNLLVVAACVVVLGVGAVVALLVSRRRKNALRRRGSGNDEEKVFLNKVHSH